MLYSSPFDRVHAWMRGHDSHPAASLERWSDRSRGRGRAGSHYRWQCSGRSGRWRRRRCSYRSPDRWVVTWKIIIRCAPDQAHEIPVCEGGQNGQSGGANKGRNRHICGLFHLSVGSRCIDILFWHIATQINFSNRFMFDFAALHFTMHFIFLDRKEEKSWRKLINPQTA